jgi:hypothetical protein
MRRSMNRSWRDALTISAGDRAAGAGADESMTVAPGPRIWAKASSWRMATFPALMSASMSAARADRPLSIVCCSSPLRSR